MRLIQRLQLALAITVLLAVFLPGMLTAQGQRSAVPPNQPHPVGEWDAVVRVHMKGHFAPLRHAASYWRETIRTVCWMIMLTPHVANNVSSGLP